MSNNVAIAYEPGDPRHVGTLLTSLKKKRVKINKPDTGQTASSKGSSPVKA